MEYAKYELNLPYPHKKSAADVGVAYFVRHFPDRFSPDMDHVQLWRVAKTIYMEQAAIMEKQFKTDALKEVGLAGHPKAEAAWSMAWDRGHSHGMQEVFHELEELADHLLL